MVNTKNKVMYKAFGFSIYSEIPFSDLPTLENSSQIDIEVIISDTPLQAYKFQDPLVQQYKVNENQVLFQIPDLATFSIENGNKIVIAPKPECDEDMLRLFILGTSMGVILMQRRIFPLHGSAIVINNKAYVIIGESGAGKSTLASVFMNRGYKLLTDDVIALTFSKDKSPIVTPSYPQQKLWIESLEKFGMEEGNYRKVYQRETKFAIPIKTQYISEPVRLGGIFELVKSPQCESLKLLKIQKLNRLQTLFNHTYRNFLIPLQGLTQWHFETSTNIINKTKMFQLQRPTNDFTAHKLANIILKTIDEEGI